MTRPQEDALLRAKQAELDARRRELGIAPPIHRDLPVRTHSGSFVRLRDVLPAVLRDLGVKRERGR